MATKSLDDFHRENHHVLAPAGLAWYFPFDSGQARHGAARHGEARLGEAGRGGARQGKARIPS